MKGILILLVYFAIKLFYMINSENIVAFISLYITLYFIGYILCAAWGITFVKRIKAKNFLKTSVIVISIRYFIKILFNITNFFKKIYKKIKQNIPLIIKIVGIILGFELISILLINIFGAKIGITISLIISIFLIYFIIVYINCYDKIEKQLKRIYNGDYTNKLKSEDFTSNFQNSIKYINDISSGFEKAIEEGIKSERLKTELITNVSHDIKTPLTSIINYVDLLKKENIENEKAKEYLDVLENKSQRLKKLTEDLVEASKASSGNVKLNFEKINICELIRQATGEFEERFKNNDLEINLDFPDSDVYIKADNRYIYRVIENLYSNISKYAMNSSRVYITIKKEYQKAIIIIKNISRDKLNISADELMQRFVRGDKSRTTEGSGLGISISKSLTELQNGTFNLQIDGDLFKVELEFNTI